MKLLTVLALTAVAGACSLRAQVDHAGQMVPIYVNNRSLAPQWVINHSQEIAGKMFGAIGVRMQWHIGAPSASSMETTRPIVVTITGHTPIDFHPGELAAALPFEGVHIRILYDRLTESAFLRNMPSILLAHVMAHEISHTLQRTDRHSTTGVMKARWKYQDFLAMQSGALPFDPVAIQMIHNGLTDRAVRLAQKAVAAASAPAPQ